MADIKMKRTKKYTTFAEASEDYGLSIATLKRMVRRGLLTRYRQPGRKETLLLRSQVAEVLQPQAS